jgi:beta-galactosidase
VLKADGQEIQSGALGELDLAPQQSRQFAIPVQTFKPAAGAEYHLVISFTLKRDLPWANAGHELAWDEFKLPDAAPAVALATKKMPRLRARQTAIAIVITGVDFTVEFDKRSAGLKSWRFQNTELVRSPLRPDFWRAQTDNDRGRSMLRSQGVWREAHQGAETRSVKLAASRQTATVKTVLALPKVDASFETDYTVHGNGDIIVAARFKPSKPGLPQLPRLGMQMTLPAGFESLTWLGPGPQETYGDRKDAKFGLYSGTVEAQFCGDYTEPGETGNKVEVRWLALKNAQGVGLLAVGMPLLSANALQFGTEDLNSATHPFQLPRRDYITLNLDLKQQGVGGDDSWGAWPHEEFLIPCKEYAYSFRLRPIGPADKPAELARVMVAGP